MHGSASNLRSMRLGHLYRLAFLAVLAAGSVPGFSLAQQTGQKTFPSAQAAGRALAAAAQSNDEQALLTVLGPGAKSIVSSGDDVEDAQNRATFVERYNEMHRMVKEPNGTTTLYVGSQNWPLPIPLVNKGKIWYFDSISAKREVLFRRIGRNEMSTIMTSKELVAAEKEYADSHNGVFAKQLFSDAGQQNGLYWKAQAGQAESPIGPLVAQASMEGYPSNPEGAQPVPYRGYYYRVLTQQGPAAKGGVKNYLIDGKMTGGFAFIAYPAAYRSSGVKTFIVCQSGVIYSKDLGPNTAAIAKAVKNFNPDTTWKKDQDQPQESATAGQSK
jgi:Protein of unknown function (DUF2950)